jgi:hypothetical protein
MKADRETAEELNRKQAVKEMVGSEGWAIVKEALFERLYDLNCVTDIQTAGDDIYAQVVGRKYAISTISSWITEVDSSVEQYQQQLEQIARSKELEGNEIVKTFE